MESSTFYTDILIAFDKEPFLYFEYQNFPDITTFQDLRLDIRLLGVKGSVLEIRFSNKNIFNFVNFINLLLDKYKKPIVFYDAKIFQSFCFKYSSKGINQKFIFDIYWYRKYSGFKNDNKFVSFKEITENFLLFTKSSLIEIYKSVFSKLISFTIPVIENQFMVDDDTAEKLYPTYIIEGQENGRLNTKSNGKRNYNPHSLDDIQKGKLVGPYENESLILFDFRSMEASVLAALSNDNKLNTVICSGKDPYEEIARYILGIKEGNLRKLGKDIFLPVIYGISAQTLADKIDITIDKAKNYVESLKQGFPDSFRYIENAFDSAKKDGYCVDFFGRKRFFDEQNSYKARNFVVQSASATVNQIILNNLVSEAIKNGYKVLFNNHDAYCISVNKKEVKKVFYDIKSILESKLELIPNLVLFAEGKVGSRLDNMIKIKK